MFQLSIILSTMAFYYESCKSGRKRERGSGVTLNQKESPHSLTLVMYDLAVYSLLFTF